MRFVVNVTETAKTEKNVANALSALKKKATGETQKKSKIPTVDLPQDLIAKAINLNTAYRDLKTAESAFEVAEGDISPNLLDLFNAQCQRDRELYSSIKFRAKDKNDEVAAGTFIVKSQLCKIDPKSEDVLREEFGEQYDELFRQETKVTVNVKKLSGDNARKIVDLLLNKISKLEVDLTDLDNDTATNLMELAGEGDTVEVDTEIKPTDQYFQLRMFDTVVAAKNERMKKNGILKPHKPSLKM